MNPQVAANIALADSVRAMRLGPAPTHGPGQNVWAMDGIDGLSGCCMAGDMACCDMLQFAGNGNGNGESLEGMSDFTSELFAAVKSAISIIPGASYVGITPENCQLAYDVITGAAAEDFKKRVQTYNDRAAKLNAALQQINTMGDIEKRDELRRQHAGVVQAQANYGKELLAQIGRYNGIVDLVEKYTVGISKPEKISAYSLSQMSLPTMSGLGGAHVIAIAIGAGVASVAIAAMFYFGGDMMKTYCNFQLRLRGIDPGLDERYSGFMGSINRITDSLGDMIKFGLIGGAAVLGWMVWKKKWIFAEKAKPVAIEIKTGPAVPQVLPEPKTAEIVPAVPQTVAANPRCRRRRK